MSETARNGEPPRILSPEQRKTRVRIHKFIPGEFFSAASSECRKLFIDGHFYGCITLAQAVAEGIAKFLAEKNSLPDKFSQNVFGISQPTRAAELQKTGVISNTAAAAFGRIDEDRNDFHHLNKDIEQDYFRLQAKAEGCVNALYDIESEVFAFRLGKDGGFEFKNPEYWPPAGPGMSKIFIRGND